MHYLISIDVETNRFWQLVDSSGDPRLDVERDVVPGIAKAAEPVQRAQALTGDGDQFVDFAV